MHKGLSAPQEFKDRFFYVYPENINKLYWIYIYIKNLELLSESTYQQCSTSPIHKTIYNCLNRDIIILLWAVIELMIFSVCKYIRLHKKHKLHDNIISKLYKFKTLTPYKEKMKVNISTIDSKKELHLGYYIEWILEEKDIKFQKAKEWYQSNIVKYQYSTTREYEDFKNIMKDIQDWRNNIHIQDSSRLSKFGHVRTKKVKNFLPTIERSIQTFFWKTETP